MAALRFDQPPESLCILRLSAIGDVTHVLPIIATLQRHWPTTRLTWIIGAMEYQLVKHLANVEFIVFDKHQGLAAFLALRQTLAGRQFDILLMMQVALRASLISLLIKARTRIGYDQARRRDLQQLFCNEHIEGPPRVHVLDTFFQFLEKIGITERDMDWLVTAQAGDREFAQNLIGEQPCVIINPCSSMRRNNWRNWLEERYAAIIDYLHELRVRVILTGGPDENEKSFAERIAGLCQHEPVNLVGKTTLTRLLALIEQSICLIAPDTGPAHIATVAGKPVIGLFASSNPLRTGPYNNMETSVNRYPDAIRRFKQKDVDEARWGERVRDENVMQLITVNDVIARLRPILNRASISC